MPFDMAKQTPPGVSTTSVDRWQRPPPVTPSGFYTIAPSSTSYRAGGYNAVADQVSQQRQLTYPPHQSSKKRGHNSNHQNHLHHRGEGGIMSSPPGVHDGDVGGGGASGGGASGGPSTSREGARSAAGACNNASGGGCSAGGSGTRGGGAGGSSASGVEVVGQGGVVPHHDLENLESCSRNPLLCLICNNIYEDPRLLACYHSFCAKCLQGRIGETRLVCPLCGYVKTSSFLLLCYYQFTYSLSCYICMSILSILVKLKSIPFV